MITLLTFFPISLLSLLLLFLPAISSAQEPGPVSILRNKAAQITHIESDNQAASFFFSAYSQDFKLPTLSKDRRHQGSVSQHPPDLTQMGIDLIGELAVWQYSQSLQSAVQQQDPIPLQTFLKRDSGHLKWLTASAHNSEIERTLALASVLVEIMKQPDPSPSAEQSRDYDVYARFFDQTYPEFIGSNNSWIALAETQGLPGISNRLIEYQDPKTEKTITDSMVQAFAKQYLFSRLSPVLRAHIVASTVRLQAGAERQFFSKWQAVEAWVSKTQQAQSLMRLCGIWQWIIHNHQNHQDHKTTMRFPPPDQYDRLDPRPSKIQIQGDTVYIRWQFPRGYQEDSLLLSARDRTIEGTFFNTAGPHGSITGRKVKACPKK